MAKGGPADHRRDAPRPQNRGGGGPIPAGPVLPPQRRCPSTTGAAPPQGGHSPAGGSLSEDRERLVLISSRVIYVRSLIPLSDSHAMNLTVSILLTNGEHCWKSVP